MDLGRVYVRYTRDYDVQQMWSGNNTKYCDFEKIIKAAALSESRRGITGLVVGKEEDVCMGKMKKLIAQKTTEFVRRINQIEGDEHMARYVSQRQIRKLMRSCGNTSRCLPCYSFAILHIIYQMIDDEGRKECRVELQNIGETVFNIVGQYYRDNENDLLALFILKSYSPFNKEVEKRQLQGPENYPSVLRRGRLWAMNRI